MKTLRLPVPRGTGLTAAQHEERAVRFAHVGEMAAALRELAWANEILRATIGAMMDGWSVRKRARSQQPKRLS